MHTRTLLAGLAFAGYTFLASAAHATPLTVSEVSFGSDFANSGPGSSVGTLDIGVNTISGTTTNLDPDYFAVTLLAGQIIEEVSVTWSFALQLPATIPADQRVQLIPGAYDTGIGFTGFVPLIGSNTATFPATFSTPGSFLANILAGKWRLACRQEPPAVLPPDYTGCLDGPWQYPDTTYTFTYRVAAADAQNPVPEPATLALLGTGVLAVALRRRLRAPV